VGVVVSLEEKSSGGPSLDALLTLTRPGMEGVNRLIWARMSK
jgi:hypothetical protein